MENVQKRLFDIKVRWFDDSALFEEDRRRLSDLFLESIGVTSRVAQDIFEVLLISKSQEISLKSSQIKEAIQKIRNNRGDAKPDKGLTDRNIQIWMKYFETIGLCESLSKRHRFFSNRAPSAAFKRTSNAVIKSLEVSKKLIIKAEKAYGIQ